jgi:hypothetical protein
MEDGHIKAQVCGTKIIIEQVFIHDQLGTSNEGVVDVTNIIIQEANIVFNKITSHDVFVKNELWNVICIKEDFHPRFATFCKLFTNKNK